MVIIVDELNTSGEVVGSMLRNILPQDDVRTFNITLAKDYLLGSGAFKKLKPPSVILVDASMPTIRAREFVQWVSEHDGCKDIPLIAISYPFPDANPEALKATGISRTLALPREFKDAEAALGQTLAPFLAKLAITPRQRDSVGGAVQEV